MSLAIPDPPPPSRFHTHTHAHAPFTRTRAHPHCTAAVPRAAHHPPTTHCFFSAPRTAPLHAHTGSPCGFTRMVYRSTYGSRTWFTDARLHVVYAAVERDVRPADNVGWFAHGHVGWVVTGRLQLLLPSERFTSGFIYCLPHSCAIYCCKRTPFWAPPAPPSTLLVCLHTTAHTQHIPWFIPTPHRPIHTTHAHTTLYLRVLAPDLTVPMLAFFTTVSHTPIPPPRPPLLCHPTPPRGPLPYLPHHLHFAPASGLCLTRPHPPLPYFGLVVVCACSCYATLVPHYHSPSCAR